jgi:hypothetical protein
MDMASDARRRPGKGLLLLALVAGLSMLIVASSLLESALLEREVGELLALVRTGGTDSSVHSLAMVEWPQSADTTIAQATLADDWRTRGVVRDRSHGAVWVVVQVSSDYSSVAGQLTSVRLRRLGFGKYELVPEASELFIRTPSSE